MSFGQTVYRLRAGLMKDPYSDEMVDADWSMPQAPLPVPRGFVAQTSTAMLGGATREQALEAKSLFCEDGFDIQKGDRIRVGASADSALYSIEGIPPMSDVNPWTKRKALREIPLVRYVG